MLSACLLLGFSPCLHKKSDVTRRCSISCVLFIVLCGLFIVLCILFILLCVLFIILCVLYIIICVFSLFFVFCSLFFVFCSLFFVFCSLFFLFCSLFFVFCSLLLNLVLTCRMYFRRCQSDITGQTSQASVAVPAIILHVRCSRFLIYPV